MEHCIRMDVYAASCTLAVVSEKGRKLKDFPVEANGQASVEATPRHYLDQWFMPLTSFT